MMKCLSEVVICVFYFMFIVQLAELGVCLNCTGSCGNRGLDIRFPFWIKDRQPEQCGYPGFDLSCNERDDIVLELPTALKLYLEKIDYKNQVIYASDPQGCLLRQHSNFNLSVFHLQFKRSEGNLNFFNCSPNKARSLNRIIPCLTTLQYDIFAINSEHSIDDDDLLSCTKMYDLPIPHDIRLSWSNPKCGSCEATGKLCRWRDNSSTELETECYGMHRQNKGAWKKTLTIGVITGFFLFGILVIAVYKIYSFSEAEKEYQAKVERFLADYRAMNPTRYSYADLKKITNQFRDELGQGAYGNVFKGKLTREIPVAVKVLINNPTGKGEEFVNEMEMMARIHHVNVVRLIGFCADGFRRALVYEYLPNGSLQKFISSADAKNLFLGWERLHHIALGIAKGIEYLHLGCDQRILHFDIKPHNILLDNDFNPKIADFGLAKLCSKDKSAISMTTARGTIGYIAPEVFSRNFGNVSYKADVYSFGMLVLEMVGGRKNFDDTAENGNRVYFPEWIYNLLEEGEEDLRFHMEEEGDAQIAKKLAIVGLWCIQWNPVDRPSMKIVVQMLEGEGDSLSKPPNPFSSKIPSRMNPNTLGRHLHQELTTISETE